MAADVSEPKGRSPCGSSSPLSPAPPTPAVTILEINMSCLFPFASGSKLRALNTLSDEKRPPSSSPSSSSLSRSDFPRANYVEDDHSRVKQDRANALSQLKSEMEERKIDV